MGKFVLHTFDAEGLETSRLLVKHSQHSKPPTRFRQVIFLPAYPYLPFYFGLALVRKLHRILHNVQRFIEPLIHLKALTRSSRCRDPVIPRISPLRFRRFL